MDTQWRLGRLAGALGVIVAVASATGCSHPSQYAAELTKAHQAGIPTDLRQIFPATPPAKDNAAPLYSEIQDDFRLRPMSDAAYTATRAISRPGATARDWQTARVYLQSRSKDVARAHAAVTRLYCVTAGRYKGWFSAAFLLAPDQGIRQASRLITIESLITARDGHALAAVGNERLCFQMAGHAASEPSAVSTATANSIDETTLRGMQRILALSSGDATAAAAIRASVTDLRLPDLARGLGYDVAGHLDCLLMYRKAGAVKALAGLANTNKYMPGTVALTGRQFHTTADWDAFIDTNAATMLRLNREQIATADLSYPLAKAGEERVQNEVAQAYQSGSADQMLDLFIRPMTGSAASRAQGQADAAVTVAAAGIFLWKAKHGRFPDSLTEAMNPVPIDPFDFKPLRYRKEGSGFVIYSVGKTLRYDGGPLKPKQYESVFRYPDAP